MTPKIVEFSKGVPHTLYSGSRKFLLNGIAVLGKPAVALASQSVITFENCYNFGNQYKATLD